MGRDPKVGPVLFSIVKDEDYRGTNMRLILRSVIFPQTVLELVLLTIVLWLAYIPSKHSITIKMVVSFLLGSSGLFISNNVCRSCC